MAMPRHVFVRELEVDGVLLDFAHHWSRPKSDSPSPSAHDRRQILTIARNVPMLVFCYGEERGPAGHVLHVEIEVVVFSERIEVREVHVQEILRAEWSERRHVVNPL